MWPPNVLPPSTLWLGGEQDPRRFDEHVRYPGPRVAVLRCSCGEIGCDSVIARIALDGDRVTWSDFDRAPAGRPLGSAGRNRLSPWDHDRLGALVFDRDQYLDALQAAAEEWRDLRGPASRGSA